MLPQFLWRESKLADLLEDLPPGGEIRLHELHGTARALAVAACHAGTGRPFLVLCRTDEVASALAAAALSLSPQRIVPRDEVLRVLTAAGYRAVSQVTEPGEFAVRGGILE